MEVYLHYCPLTPLENRLREQGGLETYGTGFIDHYIMPVIYPPGLTPSMQLFLGILLMTSYIVIYISAWRRYKKRERLG